MATTRKTSRKSAARKTTGKDLDRIEQDVHPFRAKAPLPQRAMSDYEKMVRAIGASPDLTRRLLSAYRDLATQLLVSKNQAQTYMKGVAKLHRIASALEDPARVAMAVQVGLVWLCTWAGCDTCLQGGYGLPDKLLIGCRPAWGGGWVCYYIPIPPGMC